ncbi:MAG: hypothetical protein HGA19_02685 [Oscillochloris sp.]|nr:hypothetical protein [Oscillochloris sp.]
MFDITPDEISQLNDSDLRELIGRLCEAELVSQGHSAAAVTWGGNQTAPDGGFDVRVALPPGGAIEGFIPRHTSGFQVKTPAMPRSAILTEMRPTGKIRPVIQELANEAGAYIIVSSRGSTTDSALRSRRDALREALKDVANASVLHTDFYDRTRIATWVRCHPGLITWVKERLGRVLTGWRPYGSWSGAAEGADAEYLIDDKLRLHLGTHRDESAPSLIQAIEQLRVELAQSGKIVRLVGLSGVGKTRLAQALFDSRLGSHSLPLSRAVYTNLSDNPDPQPTGLASDLIAKRTRAILIVDNCPPDLHRRLSELCSGQNSTVSVLTIEYDVRDDQPEGTHVVTLDTSSPELIEKLVQRRYPHLSRVDSRTIAEASGGNARIAIVLAQTVERTEIIAGLSNEELFQRLFHQRHDPNNALLFAAQACSLVYSFQGEAMAGEEAELPRLAALAGQSAAEIYRHVGELLRRDLAQKRGVWRAILPHAIANRLAARALEDTPFELVDEQLLTGGTERLARSFSRRLSFLYDHPKAIAIVERWLAPGGLLGDVSALNHLGQAMFENVAPVLPEKALAALERVGIERPDIAASVWRQHLNLLRPLAYDAPLFPRSAQLLAHAAMQDSNEQEVKQASDTFTSLFTIVLSGTHADIEQRLTTVEELLKSCDAEARKLGLAALDKVLQTVHFNSSQKFEFGARSRDYGYRPRNQADVERWYGTALEFIERLALNERVMKSELRELVAQNFRGLWALAHVYDPLERLSLKFASIDFWREGWIACRQTLHYDKMRFTPEVMLRLTTLAANLSPSNLQEQVRAVVLGDRSGRFDLEDEDIDGNVASAFERLEVRACELGAAVAMDGDIFTELLTDLLRGGSRLWPFGRGLASMTSDPGATWARLVEELEQLPLEKRDVQVLRGFLAELWEREQDLAQHLLDTALNQPALVTFLPALHAAVKLDERGIKRLQQALNAGQVPVRMFRNLMVGRAIEHLAGEVLKGLLLLIADQADGIAVAVELLSLRLHLDHSAQREHEPELLDAGRQLLRRITFRRDDQHRDYRWANIAKVCLTGPQASPIVADITTRLKVAVANYETYSFHNDQLLRALLELQPLIVLDKLFSGDEDNQLVGFTLFRSLDDHGGNPANVISCENLVAWCEGDSNQRYPLAASIIAFACQSEEDTPRVWSEQAISVLANAPNVETVLDVFIERFRPTSWSGSYAAQVEANAQLLDSLEGHVPSSILPLIKDAKTKLARIVAQEREHETREDRERDERFEW